jgi:5'/3'-nucleotidase SurE
MKPCRLLRRAMLVAAVGVTLGSPVMAVQAEAVQAERLHILLTNDDGYDAPGINAVRDALMAAGHDVTVVAPSEDQSGRGTSVRTRGTLDYVQRAERVWSVDGSPADSVLVGLLHVMRARAPDLVVSGANFGQNLGYAINSGTVGAATVAMYAGIPAIAVSVGVDLAEQDAAPVPFPSTFRAFDDAAELCVRIIDELQMASPNEGGLLPPHIILNINHPAAELEEIKGLRISRAARSAGVRIDYEETGEAGRLQVAVSPLQPPAADNDGSDWQSFAQGYVTISVLDGDWGAGQPMRDTVSRRLSSFLED